jgi:hypothetical protein
MVKEMRVWHTGNKYCVVFGYHNKLKFLSLQIITVPHLEAAFAFLALVGPDSYNEAEFEE